MGSPYITISLINIRSLIEPQSVVIRLSHIYGSVYLRSSHINYILYCVTKDINTNYK